MDGILVAIGKLIIKYKLNDSVIYFIQSYVLYFDYENPKTTTKVCVKTCPSEEITTPSQFESFTKMNGNLCLYNTTTGVYNKENCPKLPIYRTYI